MTPPKQEIISEKLVDEIVNASASPLANRLENLKKSMKPIDDVAAPKERKEALNMLKQTIDRKTMNEIQKKMIMEQVDEKIQMIDAQLQALEKREQELEAEAKKVKLADTTKQPETSTLTKIKNAVDELPKGVKVAAAGGIAIGLFLGIRSLFSKAKNGAKNTVSAIGSGIAKLQFALMVALVGVGGVLGFKAWEKFRKLESSIKDAKDKTAAMAEAAAKMTADTKTAAEQKAKEAADAAKKLAEKTKDAAANPEVKEKANKVADAVAEAGAFPLLAKGLITFYPSSDWALDEQTKTHMVQDFLDDNKQISMRDIFASKGNTLSPNIKIPAASKDQTNRRLAAKFVIQICEQNRERMLLTRAKDAPALEAMTLQEFIQEAAGSFESVGALTDRIREAGGDSEKILKSLDFDSLTKGDRGLTDQLRSALKEKFGKTQELPPIDLTTLAKVGQLNGTVVSFISRSDIETDPSMKMIAELCKSFKDEKIASYMLPFFHKIFPDADWDDKNMQKNMQVIENYLMDRMSVAQALRMYLYAQMMQKGNPAGLVMMQAEIIGFAANIDQKFGKPEWKRILGRATAVAGGSSWQELEEMNLKVDPTLLRKAQKGMAAVFPTAAAVIAGGVAKTAVEIIGAGRAGAEELYDFAKNNPAEFALYGGAAGLTSYGALKGINGMENFKIDNLKFIKALSANTDTASPAKWLRRSGALIANRTEAYETLKKLHNVLGDGRGINDKLSPMQELLNDFLKSKRSADDLKALKDSITKMGTMTPEINKALDAVGDVKVLKTLAKFRLGNRILSATGRTLMLDRLINTKNFEAAIDAAKVSKDTVVSALKGIGMSPAVLSKFLATPNAMQMLVKAAANGGAKAATAVINLGGRALSLVGKAGTVLAVPFDVAICLVEVLEAKKQIAGTNNESIQDIYKEDINFNVATTTIGAASTFVAGAFATAGTLAALPIALAAMGTKYTHKQLRDAALTWVKDDRDYAKETDAVLMQKLQDLAPGNFGGLGGGIVYSIDYLDKKDGRTSFNQAAEESFKGIQDANAGARFNICRALVVRNAFIAPSDNESAQEFQNKFDRQVMDEMQYIGNKTQGKFDLTNPDLFLQAKRHADLLAMSRVAKQSNESPKLEWRDGDKTESFDIKDYEDLWKKSDDPAENTRREALRSRLPEEYRKQVEVPMKLIAINAKLEEGKDAAPLISQALLQDLTIPLSKLDAQINATDFPGMWDGVTDHYDRDLSRYMAFSGIADTLDEAVADAIENGEMSVEEYDLAMQKVRSKLQSSPLDHFKAGQLAKPNIESFRNRDDLLTPNGILAALFERPESVSKAA